MSKDRHPRGSLYVDVTVRINSRDVEIDDIEEVFVKNGKIGAL